MSQQLRLENVRSVLIRLEETIIFALIERAQFRRNLRIYEPDAFGSVTGGLSLMEYCLRETECVHARMRRYTSPDENPFSKDLPEPILPRLAYATNPLHRNSVNVNGRILEAYKNNIIPLVCDDGDDEQYGSSSVCDVACLQSLSMRIHYGKFVAESKCRSSPETFDPLIQARDTAGLLELIADPVVESTVLQRVGAKARTYSTELNALPSGLAFDCDKVVEIYRRWVMPLNKDVQVAYLLQRV